MPNQKGFLSPILLAIIAVIILVIIGVVYSFLSQKSIVPKLINKAPITISGTINLDGYIPSGSTITIDRQSVNDQSLTTNVYSLPAQDGVAWKIEAVKGAKYQIKANLMLGDKKLATSEAIEVTAPAKEEVLEIISKETPVQQSQSSISGSFDINGYVPAGSIVTVFARKVGESNFVPVADKLSATDGSGWSWNTASAGVSYEIKAGISKNGVNVAQSNPVVIVAPATGEVLRIVSYAQAPTNITSASLSGVIDLNGAVPPGSSIVIVARKAGTSTYNVVASGILAQDQAQWSWGGASPGVTYNIQAVLKGNNTDLAVSNTLTATAPAANEILVLNSNYSQPQLPSPPQGPSISCAGQSNNLWSVNVTFNYVSNNSQKAAQYWVRVGDPSSDNRYLDQRVAAQNQSGETQQTVSTSYVIGNSGTYYAKYAYSYNNTSGNLNDFSSWSGTTSFSCPQSQPTNTPTPTPTLAPYTSTCNQSCGGNGYTCITGLQCITSEEIGGSLCRNPNCTAQTNCTCN